MTLLCHMCWTLIACSACYLSLAAKRALMGSDRANDQYGADPPRTLTVAHALHRRGGRTTDLQVAH